MKGLIPEIGTMTSRAFSRLKWLLSTASALMTSAFIVSLEV